MKTSLRLPGNLGWVIVWCLLSGGVFLLVFGAVADPFVRIPCGIASGLYFIASFGLARVRSWGRILAGVLMFLTAAIRLAGLAQGFSFGKAVWVAMNLYYGVYLFLPSTRRLFDASGAARYTAAGFASQFVLVVALMGVAVAAVLLKLPSWALAVGLTVFGALYVFAIEDRLNRRFARRFASRPPDLDRAAWTVVRAALADRARGDPHAAAARLAPLPDGPSVRLVRGVVDLDRSLKDGGLPRAMVDSAWVSPPAAREGILRECRESDLDALVAARAALVDGLLDDEARGASIFAGEADALIQKITGQTFITNPMFQHREAWAVRRPLCTGARGRTWLMVRLWDLQVPEAGLHVAETVDNAELRELARLSVRLDQVASGRLGEAWVAENATTLCLLPVPADGARLLFLDSPYMTLLGPEAVAARLSARLELVSRLRRLRDEFPAESWIEIPWMLGHLTAHAPLIRSRKKFERWWEERRPAQIAFDGAFVAGLDAARRGDWARAEEHFEEAERAWPERTCAAYNRGLMLVNLERAAEAEAIFGRLAEAEPDEAVFWMRTGDARRLQGRLEPAIEAYRKAATLGGLDEQVGMRLGLALASEGREEEAERELDRATQAGEADADQLEELASFLEAEGVYRLARRYREQAFLARLGDKPGREDRETDEDDDTAGAT